MTDNFYSTVDYSNWLNSTSGYLYDANYTDSYDEESYFTSYQNVSPTSNNNGTYDPNEFVLPVWRQILWSILFGGMVIVSTVGNLIVIWIVLAHKRMRTPTNYFLVNLSIADAMVSTLNVTFSFTYMLNSHWPFGTLYCKISQFVAILSIGASVFTLMAIAIDRYMAIMNPLRPRMGKRATLTIAGAVWVMGILLASPNFLYFTTWNVNLSNDEIRIVCYLEWPDGPTNHSTYENIYNVLFTLLTYFLPIGSMTFTYARVGLELWGSQSIGECTQRQLDNIKSKRRVVKMMMVVVLIFAVCWLPFQVYFILTSYYPKITKFEYIQEIYLAIYWLAMSNSMYNPIIYCWMNSRFRRGFKQFFRWCPFITLTPETLQRREAVTSRYSCSGSPDHHRIVRNDTERSFLYTCPGSPSKHRRMSGSVRIPMHLSTCHNHNSAANNYVVNGPQNKNNDHLLTRTNNSSQRWTSRKPSIS